MNRTAAERLPENLRRVASALEYPPTPDLARKLGTAQRVPRRRPAWRSAWAALAIVLLLLAASLGIPAVRAAVLEFLQIGAIRINLVEPTPVAPPAAPPTATPASAPGSGPASTPHPSPTPFDLVSWLDLQGETTLANAAQRADFGLRLPGYPADLGAPDHVFLQEIGGSLVVMLWMDPDWPEHVSLALVEIGPSSWAGEKGNPYILEHTYVHGFDALWVEGPYPLVLQNNDFQIRRLVAGKALIWAEDEITYRLESPHSLEETVKIAESMVPYKGDG